MDLMSDDLIIEIFLFLDDETSNCYMVSKKWYQICNDINIKYARRYIINFNIVDPYRKRENSLIEKVLNNLKGRNSTIRRGDIVYIKDYNPRTTWHEEDSKYTMIYNGETLEFLEENENFYDEGVSHFDVPNTFTVNDFGTTVHWEKAIYNHTWVYIDTRECNIKNYYNITNRRGDKSIIFKIYDNKRQEWWLEIKYIKRDRENNFAVLPKGILKCYIDSPSYIQINIPWSRYLYTYQ